MSAGLFALLDDVALLAKVAAASIDDVGAAAGRASAKAAGVVVDDTAVTPRYVQGFAAERELPIIRKIAVGSLRNKILLILPAIMVLSQFLPWAVTPLLMLGAIYLCYEGAEKIWERITGHEEHDHLAAAEGPDQEQVMVSGAIRTDFILSAEIMVIALGEVAAEPFAIRAIILVVVAIAITILVYGVVAMIVKMDDVGLYLAGRSAKVTRRIGAALVHAMPRLLATIAVVGIAAMLWVGGHILLVGVDELGWHPPYGLVHHAAEAAAHALPAIGGPVGWTVNTLLSAIIGLAVGAIAVSVMALLPFRKGASKTHKHGDSADRDLAVRPGDQPSATDAGPELSTPPPAD